MSQQQSRHAAFLVGSAVLLGLVSGSAQAATIFCDSCEEGAEGDCCDTFGCDCVGDLRCVDNDCTAIDCDQGEGCLGFDCGDDPLCGGDCGACDEGSDCINHLCVDRVECPDDADCSAQECGPDPVCGEPCGECPVRERCYPGNQCASCNCQAYECGVHAELQGCDCGECDLGTVCREGVCYRDSPADVGAADAAPADTSPANQDEAASGGSSDDGCTQASGAPHPAAWLGALLALGVGGRRRRR